MSPLEQFHYLIISQSARMMEMKKRNELSRSDQGTGEQGITGKRHRDGGEESQKREGRGGVGGQQLLLLTTILFGASVIVRTSGESASLKAQDGGELNQRGTLDQATTIYHSSFTKHIPLVASSQTKEYCYYETFDARCADDEVILMQRAVYGRMRFGRCVKTNFGYIGCFTNVIDLLDKKCSGRRSCSIEVVEPTFDQMKPCNMELKSYLEADYTCLQVAESDISTGRQCDLSFARRSWQQQQQQTSPQQQSGQQDEQPQPMPQDQPRQLRSIAISYATPVNKCGSELFPWRIRLQPGQRLNVSLLYLAPIGVLDDLTGLKPEGFDSSFFSWDGERPVGAAAVTGGASVDGQSHAVSPSSTVPAGRSGVSLGRVVEPLVSKSTELTLSRRMRENHVTVTESRLIEVTLNRALLASTAGGFLESAPVLLVLSVIGCSDLVVNSHTWVQYSSDRMVADVGCKSGLSGTGDERELVAEEGGGEGGKVYVKGSWKLICHDYQWVGYAENCSAMVHSQASTNTQDGNVIKLSSVLVGLIVTGVSGTISLCVLVIGLLIFKRIKSLPGGVTQSSAALSDHVMRSYPLSNATTSTTTMSRLSSPLTSTYEQYQHVGHDHCRHLPHHHQQQCHLHSHHHIDAYSGLDVNCVIHGQAEYQIFPSSAPPTLIQDCHGAVDDDEYEADDDIDDNKLSTSANNNHNIQNSSNHNKNCCGKYHVQDVKCIQDQYLRTRTSCFNNDCDVARLGHDYKTGIETSHDVLPCDCCRGVVCATDAIKVANCGAVTRDGGTNSDLFRRLLANDDINTKTECKIDFFHQEENSLTEELAHRDLTCEESLLQKMTSSLSAPATSSPSDRQNLLRISTVVAANNNCPDCFTERQLNQSQSHEDSRNNTS